MVFVSRKGANKALSKKNHKDQYQLGAKYNRSKNINLDFLIGLSILLIIIFLLFLVYIILLPLLFIYNQELFNELFLQ